MKEEMESKTTVDISNFGKNMITVLDYVNQRKRVINETCVKEITQISEQNDLIDIDTFQLILEKEVQNRLNE